MFDKLIDLIVQFAHLFHCFTYVRQYQRGVILRCGKLKRYLEPGFRWLIPLGVEEFILTTVVPEPMIVGPQSLTTKDGKRVVVHALFVVTVEDPIKFLLELEGGNVAALMLLHGTLADFVSRRTLGELTWSAEDEDQRSPSHQLGIAARKLGRKYGFSVTHAQITELVECRSLRIYGAESTIKAAS